MLIGLFIAVVVISPLLVMAVYVDDWSRDLTTNRAWTDPNASKPAMRPIEVEADWSDIEEAVDQFSEERDLWSQPQPPLPLPEDSPIHDLSASPEGEMQFHLVRRTQIVGYRDDVWVVAEPLSESRWRLHVESRSRLGKGDLGQNPRNVRELLAALAAREVGSEKSEE